MLRKLDGAPCGATAQAAQGGAHPRFKLLEDKTGSASAAIQIMSNSIMVMKFSPSLVSSSYDAWVERFGDREEATETLIKNPNLLACDPVGVTTAPVLTTKIIANIMDFFR